MFRRRGRNRGFPVHRRRGRFPPGREIQRERRARRRRRRRAGIRGTGFGDGNQVECGEGAFHSRSRGSDSLAEQDTANLAKFSQPYQELRASYRGNSFLTRRESINGEYAGFGIGHESCLFIQTIQTDKMTTIATLGLLAGDVSSAQSPSGPITAAPTQPGPTPTANPAPLSAPRTTILGAWKFNPDDSDDPRKRREDSRDENYHEIAAKFDGTRLVSDEKDPRGNKMSRTFELSSDGRQLYETLHMTTGRNNTALVIRYVYDMGS